MTPLDAALVRRKLALIVQNLGDLSSIGALSIGEYQADRIRRKAAERLLQEAIEASVDINLHLLREKGEPSPPDYFGSFVLLGATGVIPADLADRLAPPLDYATASFISMIGSTIHLCCAPSKAPNGTWGTTSRR